MSDWREVSKGEPCPVCGKPGWCSIIGPEGAIEAAVCMRIESANARPNGGWFHRLRESSEWQSPRVTSDKPRVFNTAHEAIQALEKQHGPRSKFWSYCNAAGDPVGVVVRWDRNGEKTIRPVSRVDGGWIIGAMPGPRPLYQLADVKAASQVFVCEGEKAADAIRSLGLTGATSAGGSSAAAKTDWAPLAGKSVIVLPDNDQPGVKFRDAVLAILAGLTPPPTLRVVELPNLPAAGDAADWLAAGGTHEQLETLVANAEPVALTRMVPVGTPAMMKRQPKQILLADAVQGYIDRLRSGATNLIETSITELDYALGGGVELGEMVIAAARPSHGKSAFALQCGHHWTALGLPTLMISEEMSALALGKRTLQFITPISQEHWKHSAADLERDLSEYAADRAPCIISEPCITPGAVVESIERAIGEHGVQAVIIDYAQLLQGQGRSRYEQVSHVSNTLREAASRFGVLLLSLCQLNREVEKRTKFIPCTADIRDAGTLEQDADVILLLAWPHRVDATQPSNQYQIFVSKNRNRAINQPVVVCRFDPSRQMITEASAREHENYHPEFDMSFDFP
jgi:hypothetical protein